MSDTSAKNQVTTPLGSAQAALEWVEDGMTLGLGTGRAASAFVKALGARVAQGLQVVGVPTSDATGSLARSLGIPLARLEEVDHLDITFDGADEVDNQLNCIKGYGAAMVREKIVAASSDRLVILVGPEKIVGQLGERGRLPIEVLPFGEPLVRRKLADLGLDSTLRQRPDARAGDEQVKAQPPLAGTTFTDTPLTNNTVTDNGNWILDAKLSPPLDARALEDTIVALPGVLGTGFFLDMADSVVIGDGHHVEIRHRS